MDTSVVAARALVDSARRITVLTGAGVSTASGIPDYRGPNGLWTKDPAAERLSDIRYYTSDPAVRRLAWQRYSKAPITAARPNLAHEALLRLERDGRLLALVTQNVDGLHHAVGHDPAKVVEIHGTLRSTVCLACDEHLPVDDTLARVRAGEDDPPCLTCGGMLKAATISFGQALRDDDVRRANEATMDCDLFIAVGTSLAVYPVANLPRIAVANGARFVIVNGEPTVMDEDADVVVHGDAGEILDALTEQVAA